MREWHGTNAFIREGDAIYRTYMIDARGDEKMGNTWNYLDITALGRQEEWEDSPEGYPQTAPYGWWNYHDRYGGRRVIAHVSGIPARGAAAARGRGRGSLWSEPGSAVRGSREFRGERTADADDRAHLRGAGRARVRRVHERGGHAALVARRATTGRRPRPRVDLRIGGEVRVVMRNPHKDDPSTAAAASTPRSSRRAASPSPGSGTTTATRSSS